VVSTGAGRKGADAPVPEDRLRLEHDLAVELLALWARVQALPAVGDALRVGRVADLKRITIIEHDAK
jgi:hypothetical protein